MKRWAKRLLVLLVILGLGVVALRWALLPGVLAYAQTSLRSMGLPEAVLRQEGWAFTNPHIGLYAKAGENTPLLSVRLRFLPTLWSSLLGAAPAVYLSELKADCAQLPTARETSSVTLPLAPVAPPALPQFMLYSGAVELQCGAFSYQAHKFSLVQQANGLSFEADGFLQQGDQQFALSGGLFWPQDGAFSSTLQLDGGILHTPFYGLGALPTISLTQNFIDGALLLTGTAQAAQLPLAALELKDIALDLNPAQKAGAVLPVTLKATLNEQPLQFDGSLDLAKCSISGNFSGGLKMGVAEAVGIKAELLVPDITKPSLAEKPFSITALQLGGLPLTAVNGTLAYANGAFKLGKAQALLFGGQVALSPITLALPVKALETTASFTGLDLSQIIQLGAVDGLGGTGRLSGKVPISYKGGKISLGASELTATSTGNIVYNPPQMPAFMAEGGQASMLGQIFKDFAYDGLTLRLGGTLGGEKSDTLTLGVRLAGSNPSFYNGHPVVFNLNLSGALESLLTKGLASFQFSPEELGQLVKEGEKP